MHGNFQTTDNSDCHPHDTYNQNNLNNTNNHPTPNRIVRACTPGGWDSSQCSEKFKQISYKSQQIQFGGRMPIVFVVFIVFLL